MTNKITKTTKPVAKAAKTATKVTTKKIAQVLTSGTAPVVTEAAAPAGLRVVAFDENGPRDLGEQSPEGIHNVIADALGETAAPAVAAPVVVKAPKSDELPEDQRKLLVALLNAEVFGDKPVDDRVGQWVRAAVAHKSSQPHGLPMGRIPGLMGGLKRRGLVECGWDKAATVRLTPAGLAAGKAR